MIEYKEDTGTETFLQVNQRIYLQEKKIKFYRNLYKLLIQRSLGYY